MATNDIGRVTPIWKGFYSAATAYELNDIVIDANGSVWWHKGQEITTGVNPAAGDTWAAVLDMAVFSGLIQAAIITAQTAVQNAQAAESGIASDVQRAETAAGNAETYAQNAQSSAANVGAYAQAAEAAKTVAQTAQTGAETAQTAAERAANSAGGSANDAAIDAASASSSAFMASAQRDLAINAKRDAEAWAKGTKEGEDVGSDDPAYHNNAKYCAEQAGTSAAAAAASADSAAQAALTGNLAEVFDPTRAYNAGDPVIYDGTLYFFTDDHAAGAWTGSDAEADKIAPEVAELRNATGDMIDDLAYCGDYNILKNLADDNFTDINKWTITVGTALFSDNVCQFSLTNTESSTCGVQYAFDVVSGHKYYTAAEFKADHTPNTLSIGLSSANTAVTSQFTTPGVYNHISAIVTAGDSDTKYRVKIYPKSTKGFAVGDVVYIRKPMAIDLTATFGAGMEPDVDTIESALHRYFSDRSIVDVNSGNDVASTDLITKLSAPRKLTVPSYDGSGQNVHPSIVSFRSAWHGHRYWMAITPYPNTQDQYENPSILVSDDGDTWSVPNGLTNPIFPGPTTNPINGVHVHNNDPCLVYYNSKLYCYFNTWDTETGATRLYRMDSSDGVTWGNGTECTFAESGRQTEPSWTVLSPSVIKLSSGWVLLWGQYKKMYRATSSDGISWSAPEKIAFDLPDNIDMWHCSFSYELNGYICVLSAHKDNETQNDNALYIGKSDDGLTFFFNPTPILEPFGNDYANKQIYKSCLAKIGDGYRIYFSCQNTSSQWAVGCFDIKFNNVQMTANSVTVLLANSDDAFIIPHGQTKTFGVLAPIGETSTLAVRTVNAADLECKVAHETVAGITASSEVVMTMSAETNKSCTFDNRSERFQILIKNTGSEDEKLHTVLVMMYA